MTSKQCQRIKQRSDARPGEARIRSARTRYGACQHAVSAKSCQQAGTG